MGILNHIATQWLSICVGIVFSFSVVATIYFFLTSYLYIFRTKALGGFAARIPSVIPFGTFHPSSLPQTCIAESLSTSFHICFVLVRKLK